MIVMNLLSRWLESLDYEYRISPDCSRHLSHRSGCMECISSCPVDAITLEDGKPVIDTKACIDCGDCVASCPVQAVEGFLPKRTIKSENFIIEENSMPTVKELLVYYKKGITTLAFEDIQMNEEWEETIKETNRMLVELGELPFQVSFDEVESEKDMKISRRELFFIWERGMKNYSKKLAPAEWRFNHESLDLSKHYPDHQFTEISIDTKKCTLCKACEILCKKESLEINDTHFSISAQQCSNCSLCQDMCPEGAISLKQMITPAKTVDHDIYTNLCSSCEETFPTLDKEEDLCFLCMKREEYALMY